MRSALRFVKRACATATFAALFLGLAAACSHVEAQSAGQGAAQGAATINGTVKSASGEPLAGAFVRVRGADSPLVFLVVSQAQGRFTTPNLIPGKYTVEGIGGDNQSAATDPIDVKSGQSANVDITLSAARKPATPRKRLTLADYAAVLPDEPGKQLVLAHCVSCHDLEGVDTVTLSILDSGKEWIEDLGVHKYYTEDLPDHPTDAEWATLIDYMTRNFSGDGHPPKLPREQRDRNDTTRQLPRTLLKGAEANYVGMEFNLRKGAFPHDVSVDSQGVAWISEHSRNEHAENGVLIKPDGGMIGRIDPKTWNYTHVAVPAGKVPPRPSGGHVDAQGIFWQTDNSHNARLIAYNTKSGEFKTYDMPAPPRQKDNDESGFGDSTANMNSLVFEDGFVYGSGLLDDEIYRLDPASGGVITYPTPKGRPPYGLAFDNHKMLWYSVEYGDEIVKLDPATGKRTSYKIPTPHADLRHIQTDADGNVWASAQESDKLIKVDARTGEVSEYDPPTKFAGVDSVDIDRQHNFIWIGENQADKLARFDPRTRTFVEYALPTAGSGIKRITVDPSNPNRVWWCNTGSDRAGYIEVLK